MKYESSLKKRHIELSWKLIEHKIMYYYPDKIAEEYHNKLIISDQQYEEMERRYLRLCRKLGFPNTIVHAWPMEFEDIEDKSMFEIDFRRPSVQLVLSKYGSFEVKHKQARRLKRKRRTRKKRK